MGHKVELKDLQSWLEDEPFHVFASSTKEPKKLIVHIGSKNYKVIHKGEVVYSGMQPYQAVEAYNNL